MTSRRSAWLDSSSSENRAENRILRHCVSLSWMTSGYAYEYCLVFCYYYYSNVFLTPWGIGRVRVIIHRYYYSFLKTKFPTNRSNWTTRRSKAYRRGVAEVIPYYATLPVSHTYLSHSRQNYLSFYSILPWSVNEYDVSTWVKTAVTRLNAH